MEASALRDIRKGVATRNLFSLEEAPKEDVLAVLRNVMVLDFVITFLIIIKLIKKNTRIDRWSIK